MPFPQFAASHFHLEFNTPWNSFCNLQGMLLVLFVLIQFDRPNSVSLHLNKQANWKHKISTI